MQTHGIHWEFSSVFQYKWNRTDQQQNTLHFIAENHEKETSYKLLLFWEKTAKDSTVTKNFMKPLQRGDKCAWEKRENATDNVDILHIPVWQ